MKNKVFFGVLALVFVVVSSQPVAFADGGTIVVDDDRRECPDAQFTSIQTAVVEAAAGDTVEVCPGLYRESVAVSKPLTLVGARPQRQPDERCDGAVVDPTREAVLNHSNGGFDLRANDVTVVGFTIQSASQPPVGAGITTSSSFSGYRIEDNVIQKNRPGIFLHSDGARPTVVRGNCLRENPSPPPFGPTAIVALSNNRLANAALEHNFFTGHAFGMGFFGTQSALTIRHNRLIDGGSIELRNTTSSVIAHNLSVDARRHAVSVGGGSRDVIVRANRLSAGQLAGVVVFAPTGQPAVTDVLVESNHITEFPRGGILLSNASGNTLQGNSVSLSGTPGGEFGGISIANGSNHNIVRGNRLQENRPAGIRVRTLSTGNVIVHNRAFDNVDYDCQDETVGEGTEGTANVWGHNRGETASPPGICQGHPATLTPRAR